MWSPAKSWLSKINPLTKAYLLLFVILFLAFFSNYFVVVFLALALILLLFVSQISLKFFFKTTALYLIMLIPLSFLLAWLELGTTLQTLELGSVTYLRFFDIIFAGTLFALTTNPSDISLFFFRFPLLRPIGIALSAGLSSLMFMGEKIYNTISLQRLRGAEISLNPKKFRKSFQSLQAMIIPVILQAIDLSQSYTDALVARGYNTERKINLPPYLRFRAVDYLIIVIGTLLLVLGIYSL